MILFASDFSALEPIALAVVFNGGYFLLLIISALLRRVPSTRHAGIMMQRILALAGWVALAGMAVLFFAVPEWTRLPASWRVTLIAVTILPVSFMHAVAKDAQRKPVRRIARLTQTASPPERPGTELTRKVEKEDCY